MFFLILNWILIAFLACLLVIAFRRDIMYFQQNSYRGERYTKWLKQSGDTTSYTRLIGIFLFLFCISGFRVYKFGIVCGIVFAVAVSIILCRKKYKKPLAVTNRVKRILTTELLVALIIAAVGVMCSVAGLFGVIRPIFTAALCLLLTYCFSPYILLFSAWLLRPVENSINRGFYNSAKAKLYAMPELKIIGITGSYGKTSTKHFLYRIMSEHKETLMTPGSYNTTLGVVRTINEQLKPYHEVFIVEMGAKQSGDIKEICELVKPHIGIITAVGPQHLETFKTLENVCRTKFELVDSLSAEGTAILNNDYPIISHRKVSNCNVIRYSLDAGDKAANYFAFDTEYTPNGTKFKLQCPDGLVLEMTTQLMGRYNIENLVGAIAAARTLGVPDRQIQYAVGCIEPVEHRLNKKMLGPGIVLLDDAFNSNPQGAAMAVEVLSLMPGRRIIITPGMIELGEQQYEQNEIFGQNIASRGIEIAAIVGQYNKDAITAGLVKGGKKAEEILFFDTFNDANKWLLSVMQTGDVILLENDLPDTFK